MQNRTKITAMLLACLLLGGALLTGCNKTEDEAKRYNYDLTEYITMIPYKGIAVTKYGDTVTDEDVEQQVLMARTAFATYAEKQDAIVKGDQVDVSFMGYMDGVAFDSGTGTKSDLTIGSGAFIDGFEDGLIGAKAGDTVTLELHFPDPYPNNTELSGKPVTFEVTVNKVLAQALPEYNDAFVKEKYNYDTVEAFETALRQALENQWATARENYLSQEIWNKLMNETEVKKFPETEYNALYDEAIAYYTTMAESEKMSLNEYVAESFQITIAEFRESIEASVKETVLQEMILFSIARAEDITVSEEDYALLGVKTAQYYGLSSLEELEQYFTKEEITDSILFDLVTDFLLENAIEQ